MSTTELFTGLTGLCRTPKHFGAQLSNALLIQLAHLCLTILNLIGQRIHELADPRLTLAHAHTITQYAQELHTQQLTCALDAQTTAAHTLSLNTLNSIRHGTCTYEGEPERVTGRTVYRDTAALLASWCGIPIFEARRRITDAHLLIGRRTPTGSICAPRFTGLAALYQAGDTDRRAITQIARQLNTLEPEDTTFDGTPTTLCARHADGRLLEEHAVDALTTLTLVEARQRINTLIRDYREAHGLVTAPPMGLFPGKVIQGVHTFVLRTNAAQAESLQSIRDQAGKKQTRAGKAARRGSKNTRKNSTKRSRNGSGTGTNQGGRNGTRNGSGNGTRRDAGKRAGTDTAQAASVKPANQPENTASPQAEPVPPWLKTDQPIPDWANSATEPEPDTEEHRTADTDGCEAEVLNAVLAAAAATAETGSTEPNSDDEDPSDVTETDLHAGEGDDAFTHEDTKDTKDTEDDDETFDEDDEDEDDEDEDDDYEDDEALDEDDDDEDDDYEDDEALDEDDDDEDDDGPELTVPERDLNALMRIVESAGNGRDTRRITPHVVVRMWLSDLILLAERYGLSQEDARIYGITAHGLGLDAGQLRQLLVRSGVLPVVLGGNSQPLDVGRSRRFPTAAIQAAVLARDGGCDAPGCSSPPERVQFDHYVVPWAEGGVTSVANLMALCEAHHTDRHAGHLTVVDVDGVPHVVLPEHVDQSQRPRRNTLWGGLQVGDAPDYEPGTYSKPPVTETTEDEEPQ